MKLVSNVLSSKAKTLANRSKRAYDVVTSTIQQLETVNDEINTSLGEINEARTQLQTTEDELNVTKAHNTKVIEKFKALIEV